MRSAAAPTAGPAYRRMIGAFHAFWIRLRDVFRRRQLDTELGEEIRLHLEMKEAAERAAGLPGTEAGRSALQQFGHVDRIKEECRDEWSFVWLEHLRRDIGFACRALAKSPGFVLGVIGTLAIAIGGAAALLAISLQVLQPSLPYADPSTILVVQPYNIQTNAPAPMSAAQFAGMTAGTTAFAQLAAQHTEQMNLVFNDRPTGVKATWITPDFFGTFGVLPKLGRVFAPDEYLAANAGSVVVLTHSTWVTVFGRDPGALDRTVVLGGQPRRVIGIMPESFRSPVAFPSWDVFLPTNVQALVPGEWWHTLVWAIGRLKPGVTLSQAQAELAAIPSPADLPTEITTGIVTRVVPVRDLYHSDRDRVITVLFAYGVFLYVMACASTFNLVVLRVIGRYAELNLRAALGGCARRIVQLLVVENLLLIGAAGAAAGILAGWFCALLVHALHYWWPSAGPLSVDRGSLCGLVGVATLGAVAVVGLAPVFVALRGTGLGIAAKRTRPLIARHPLRRWRSRSTVAQATLAVIMLVGAALCGRALLHLTQSDLGFDPVRKIAVTAQLRPQAMTYPPPTDAYLALAARLQTVFAQLPGVERSALASRDPLSSGEELRPVRINGASSSADILCSFNRVSPEYFAALELPLLRGRGFEGMRPNDPGVVVINETMAQKYFPDETPLGRRLHVGSRGQWHILDSRDANAPESWEIVGVVKDVRDEAQRRTPRPQCYVPFWQRNPYDVNSLTVILRLQGVAPAEFAASVRRSAFEVDPALVICDVASLEERAEDALHLERCVSVTLGVVAIFALALAGTGIFSVLDCLVAAHRREFGVRLALGAPPRSVQWFVLRCGLGWTMLGIVIGLGVSWALTRILQVVLYATSPHEPVVFGGVALFVLAVATFACWLPARRAGKTDLMSALRAD